MSPVLSLSYAFSGNRGTGRTSLYKQCESYLPNEFPGLKFAFLKSPLGHLPCPLLAGVDHKLHATTILFDCWRRLNEFSIRRLRPALLQGEIAIMDGFGLDALLYATACSEGDVLEHEETVRLHHGLVQARLRTQDILPPHYFVLTAETATAEACMLRTTRGAKNLTAEARRAFIKHENDVITQYFKPGNGQSGQFLDVDAHDRVSLFEMIVARIHHDTRTQSKVA